MASSQSSGPGNRGPRSTANSAAEVRGTLDLSQPIGLSLFAILHFFPDTDRPLEILRQLLAILPPGAATWRSRTSPPTTHLRKPAD